jgi:hypothetical protein
MNSSGITYYTGRVAPSLVFPSVFSQVNTYSIMVKINDAPEIRRLVKANDSFNHQSEINNTFPKNCGNLFQFYINVEGLDHNNGFFNFDDLLTGLGKISEIEYITYKDKIEEIREKIDNHEQLIYETTHSLVRMNTSNTTVLKVLNEELEELEQIKLEAQYQFNQWEDQELLLENICINLRKCIYWFFFNENQQKQYPSGLLFIPKISNETIELLDSIFNQEAQMETITNRQVDKHITDYEVVNELCKEYQRQRTELGETIELLEASIEEEEEEEEEEDEESETDNESVWETTSINENENPDKSDATSESSELTESEDDDEPLKVDECQTCIDYHYLLNEIREKDKKIKNLEEIIKTQDKQIEEYEEKEENDRDANYKELEEAYELLNQKRWKEKDEHNKTIIDYATRVNELIDELRILRKQKNEIPENI